MKLSNWVAIIGCVGLGVGAAVSAQGCTATATVEPCSGSDCYSGEDSGSPVSQDSGTPATTEDSGTVSVADSSVVDAGPDATQSETCNSCLYGQCVGQYANCVADQAANGCLAIYQCATSAACVQDGGNCVQDCYEMGTTAGQPLTLSQQLYLALGDCDQGAQCVGASPTGTCASICSTTAASCTVQTEDAGEDAAVVDAGACSACQASLCGPELTACGTGSACAAYNQCLLSCTTPACDTACASTDDAGASAAAALGTCTASNCAAACQ
jgi:hypothetical protein